MQEKKRPVAITVSTNYSDILPYTLAQNAGFFDHWYIVTAPDDSLTHQVLAEFNSPNITRIDYNFRSTLTDHLGNTTYRHFDKGGAIRLAQESAYREWPNHWYLVLDTDILIRSHRDLMTTHLCKEWIWGPQCRLDYPTLSAYKQQEAQPYFHNTPRVIGFFQLYKQHRYYLHSMDTNLCDDEFTNLWPREQQHYLPITVDHLGAWGPTTLNTHRGRILGNGFGE